MSRTQALTHVIFLTSLMMMMTACSKRFTFRETSPVEKQSTVAPQRVVASAVPVTVPDEGTHVSPAALDELPMQVASSPTFIVSAIPKHAADTFLKAGHVVTAIGAEVATGTLITGLVIKGGFSGNLWLKWLFAGSVALVIISLVMLKISRLKIKYRQLTDAQKQWFHIRTLLTLGLLSMGLAFISMVLLVIFSRSGTSPNLPILYAVYTLFVGGAILFLTACVMRIIMKIKSKRVASE